MVVVRLFIVCRGAWVKPSLTAAVNCCMQCMCRHTEEMIEKLESAGLGFYVKATETQQKLGEFTIICWWFTVVVILLLLLFLYIQA